MTYTVSSGTLNHTQQQQQHSQYDIRPPVTFPTTEYCHFLANTKLTTASAFHAKHQLQLIWEIKSKADLPVTNTTDTALPELHHISSQRARFVSKHVFHL